MSVNGQNMKMEMPMDQVMESANAGAFDFPEDAISNESLEETADGGYSLSFTLAGDAIKDLLDTQLSSIYQTYGNDIAISFDYIDFQATLDQDGMLKTTDMEFPMQFEVEGQAIEASYNIRMEVTQYGDVTIEFPADLDSYVDVTEQAAQPQ